MVYPFKCESCDVLHDIVRPYTAASNPANCPTCGAEMQRIYTVPRFNCTVSKPSRVFGIDMANKHAVDDMRRAYRDKTGSDMVEIGNERVTVAPRRSEYTIERGAFD